MTTLIPSLFFVLFSLAKGALLYPENGAELNHIQVLFEWEQIPLANSYHIQIDENANFSNPLITAEDNTLLFIEMELLDWDETYHWRVQPIFPSGETGNWSELFSFTTGSRLSETTTTISNVNQIQEGVTVFGAFFNYFSAVVDQFGREIWNSSDENIVYYSIGEYGDLFGCYLNSGTENNLPGIEFAFDVGTVWNEPNDEFLHHDMIQLPNGNYLGIVETSSLGPIPIGEWTSLFQSLGFIANGVTIEFPWIGDKLIEWDKETKEVVWTWNVFNNFNMADYDQYGGTWNQAYLDLHYDWTHVNAVIFDEDESAIYISTRHLSRITKINYPSGEIIWNMGHQMASSDVDMGTDIGFSFQHSLQILDNGNILTFDNGNLSPEFRGTEEPVSRAIEIEVTESDSNYSTELAWSYELPNDLFGFASGNTQKLQNGNVLITTVGGGGTSLEVTTEGDIVWEAHYNLTLPNGAVYRAHRIPGLFPTAFSVLIDNYQMNGEYLGVYLSPGTSDISFSLVHEGGFGQSFTYELEDESGWFNLPTGSLFLEPGESESLVFSGNVAAITGGNTITLSIVPDHHPEKTKIINVTGYTSPLAVDGEILPRNFELRQPFPNPFNPTTTIRYSIKTCGNVFLCIYDITGRLVETLVEGNLESGLHEAKWNAGNQSSGLYFVKLTNNDQVETRKIIYLK